MIASASVALPHITPNLTFEGASQAVVAYLSEHIPMGYWAVTRYDGSRQLYLEVRDDVYGRVAGDSHPWDASFCKLMVAGEGPQVAPDAMSVPSYAATGVVDLIPIGAYVGIPIRRSDGELFGTICGLDPAVKDPEFAAHAPLLELLSQLLVMVLEADLTLTEQQRVIEKAELLAHTDPLTELLNRRGWDRALVAEDSRARRFGDPGAVLVIDLDLLKHVNDTGGHLAGDRHLQAAADALRSCVREYDHLARVGGDEFAVLAASTTPEGAGQLAGRVESALAAAGVQASIGYAPFTIAGGFTGATLEADAAMYATKDRRRRARAHAA